MTTFTVTWNASFEAEPSGTEDIRLGDDRIRALKEAVRERMAVDHFWGQRAGVASVDHGKHIKVSFRSLSEDPNLETGDGALYMDNSTNGALKFKNKTGTVTDLATWATGAGLLTPTRLSLHASTTADPEASDLQVGEIWIKYGS